MMQAPLDKIYEQVLVLRCQAGDEAAFAELVRRYGPRLSYYLRKLLEDRDAADDVLQDVWFDVFRGVGRLANPGAFATWLYRIARDHAYRHFRRRRPRQQLAQDDELIDESNADREFSAEDAERVHRFLDQLPPEHREVLVLRFVEAMSYDEIAQVTGLQLGTVKSRIHYAKRALRRAMERKCNDD